jgi:small conductance mechanosensitive channel
VTLDFDHLGNLFVAYVIDFSGAVADCRFWMVAGRRDRAWHAARADVVASHGSDDRGFSLEPGSLCDLVIVFVIILQVLGVQATSLVAVIGAASLAIGLALQGTLAHMAAGVMLLIFRPFRIGDSIEVAGKNGTVKNLNLFMTELASSDNIQVLIPLGCSHEQLCRLWNPQNKLVVPVTLVKDAETASLRLRSYP